MASNAARDALSLWDIHSASGGSATLHNQTRRFLDPQWTGLCNDEVPLRKFVQRMAEGETVLGMLKKDYRIFASLPALVVSLAPSALTFDMSCLCSFCLAFATAVTQRKEKYL